MCSCICFEPQEIKVLFIRKISLEQIKKNIYTGRIYLGAFQFIVHSKKKSFKIAFAFEKLGFNLLLNIKFHNSSPRTNKSRALLNSSASAGRLRVPTDLWPRARAHAPLSQRGTRARHQRRGCSQGCCVHAIHVTRFSDNAFACSLLLRVFLASDEVSGEGIPVRVGVEEGPLLDQLQPKMPSCIFGVMRLQLRLRQASLPCVCKQVRKRAPRGWEVNFNNHNFPFHICLTPITPVSFDLVVRWCDVWLSARSNEQPSFLQESGKSVYAGVIINVCRGQKYLKKTKSWSLLAQRERPPSCDEPQLRELWFCVRNHGWRLERFPYSLISVV